MKSPFVILILLCIFPISVYAQKIKVKPIKVGVQLVKLPKQKLDRDVQTYQSQVTAQTNAYWTNSFTPESLIKKNLKLEGFAQSDGQADLMLYLKTGDFEEVEVELEIRLKDEEKDSVESNMKYAYRYHYKMLTSLEVRDARNTVYQNTVGVGVSKDFRSSFYPTKAQADEARAKYEREWYQREFEKHVKHHTGRLNLALNQDLGYSVQKQTFKLYAPPVDKFPDYKTLTEEINEVKNHFASIKATEPIPSETRQNILKVMAKWQAEEPALSASDKKLARLKFAYLSNIMTTAFNLEEFETAEKYAQQLIDTKLGRADGRGMKSAITELKATFAKLDLESRHFVLPKDQPIAPKTPIASQKPVVVQKPVAEVVEATSNLVSVQPSFLDNTKRPSTPTNIPEITKPQARLFAGETPLQLFKSGVPMDSLYGLRWAGGLIFYLDTLSGDGLVAAIKDFGRTDRLGQSITPWGCINVDFEDKLGLDLFDGARNTEWILEKCQEKGTPARICADLEMLGYTDWYLPSAEALKLIMFNLAYKGTSRFVPAQYASSSLWDGTSWSDEKVTTTYIKTYSFPNKEQIAMGQADFAFVKTYFSGSVGISRNKRVHVRPVRKFSAKETPTEAQRKIALGEEKGAWQLFESRNTLLGYKNFVFMFPNGNYRSAAEDSIRKLERNFELDKLEDYATVKINGKTWLAENLNLNLSGSTCFNDKLKNCDGFGRIYTLEAATEGCKAFGPEWRIPTTEEWKALAEMAGGLQEKRAITGDPQSAFYELATTKPNGFNAALGGIQSEEYDFQEMRITTLGKMVSYWGDSSDTGGNISAIRLSGKLNLGMGITLDPNVAISGASKSEYHYVRCIRD